MPSTGAGGDEVPPGATETQKRPVRPWQNPLAWIIAVFAVLMAAVFLSGWLESMLTSPVATKVDPGEPVAVAVGAPEQTWGDVSLPPEVQLSADELEQLGRMNVPDQAAWLEERGGIIAGNRRFLLTLRGNRPEPVQVTGIRDASKCSTPRRGTLMRLIPAGGGAVPSVELGISVGEAGSGAWFSDQAGRQHPYFPGRTITLRQGQEEQLMVELSPSRQGQVCQPSLEMTVLADGRGQLQRIPAEGKLVPVMRPEDDDAERRYAAVYLGGRLCPAYVPAMPGWRNSQDFQRICRLG
jgi:hypothetical protein